MQAKVLWRKLEAPQDIRLDFASNDYLSLADLPELRAAYVKAFEQQRPGSRASMLAGGRAVAHRDLEREFASALGVEDCLFLASGYVANLSIARLLQRLEVDCYIDKGCHASIYDGLSAAGLAFQRVLHQNPSALAKKLQGQSRPGLFWTESVFSMTGQISPLQDFFALPTQLPLQGILDEAHAFGLLGQEGLGLALQAGLTAQQLPLRCIPLGKSMAGMGAIIAGQGLWIDCLLQRARPLIYSTAPSPAYAQGLLKAFELMRKADARRTSLWELVAYFKSQAAKTGLAWKTSDSPIQILKLGNPLKAVAVANALREQGIYCLAIREPTVAKAESGLRLVLNYGHDASAVDSLLAALVRILQP